MDEFNTATQQFYSTGTYQIYKTRGSDRASVPNYSSATDCTAGQHKVYDHEVELTARDLG